MSKAEFNEVSPLKKFIKEPIGNIAGIFSLVLSLVEVSTSGQSITGQKIFYTAIAALLAKAVVSGIAVLAQDSNSPKPNDNSNTLG